MDEVPISVLGLPTRITHLLLRNRINSVGFLQDAVSKGYITNFKGVGEKTIQEINDALEKLISGGEEKNISNIHFDDLPEETKASDNQLNIWGIDSLLDQTELLEDFSPITELNLTINLFSILNNAAIQTIQELFTILRDDTKVKIFEADLQEVLKSILFDYAKSVQKAEQTVLVKTTDPENEYLLPLQDNKTPLEQLYLPIRPLNAIKKIGLSTVGDLASLMLQESIYSVNNIGDKSVKEMTCPRSLYHFLS